MGTQVCDVLAAKVALFSREGGENFERAAKGLLLASDQVKSFGFFPFLRFFTLLFSKRSIVMLTISEHKWPTTRWSVS